MDIYNKFLFWQGNKTFQTDSVIRFIFDGECPHWIPNSNHYDAVWRGKPFVLTVHLFLCISLIWKEGGLSAVGSTCICTFIMIGIGKFIANTPFPSSITFAGRIALKSIGSKCFVASMKQCSTPMGTFDGSHLGCVQMLFVRQIWHHSPMGVMRQNGYIYNTSLFLHRNKITSKQIMHMEVHFGRE